MHILHYYHHYAPCRGGIESVMAALCKHARAAGHNVEVVCLNKCPRKNETLPKESVEEGVSVHRHAFIALGPYRFCPGALKYAKHADVLHVHGLGFFLDALVLTKFLHRKPIVLSTHGGIFHTSTSILKRLYFFLWARLILGGVDKVVAVSRQDKELFSKILPKHKLTEIENGLDLEPFSNLDIKKDSNRIVFVGRLSKNKRVDRLLSAFAVLAKQNPKATLHVVGGDYDHLLSSLKSQVQQAGLEKRVTFLGDLPSTKMRTELAKAKVFASASEYEGFGITAIEAMAAGCVPVLNAIAPFKRLLRGKNPGQIVDFSSKQKALRALKKALSSSAQAQNEAMALAKTYGWGPRANMYIGIYRLVAE